ncbi:nucleobase-containing compound biosynthetic process [Desmophyllum pertusum]|uniref:Nucleobase-containing compound biosynthetic process n=1 Tax=Desmophyllum pertusum TaxID=174260 RepID=A0A9W9ZFG3_9CNID|nr:nucleobase-containing compound biosynthetic process [Desmophyllum pertusum]
MEKIITVKQEPIDDAYPTPPSTTTTATSATSTTTTAQNVTAKTSTVATLPSGTTTTVTATAVTRAPETQIFFIQPKPEVQKTQCSVVSGAQGSSASTSTARTIITTSSQSKPPLVVISGSPIKLTPLSRAGAALAGGQTNSGTGNITCTLVHVQPFNAAAKQHIAPKAGGSPNKQSLPLQLQKLVPISVVTTSLAKIQSGTAPQFTIAGPLSNVRHIAPKVNIVSALPSGQAVQLTTPSLQVRNIVSAEKTAQGPQQLAPKPIQTQASSGAQQPRLIVPALPSSIPQITGTGATANLQFPHGVISGGVVYLPQQALASGGFPIAVPIQANALNAGAQGGMTVNGSSPESSPPNRPRKPCNCTKSQCLKLYCDCFANGEFCSNCNCVNCSNNMEHEKERSKAIKACLERNPQAFHPKIGKGRGDADRRHNKGCHCKRSGCLKNYCECYEAKILCTNLCKCTGCKNFEESPERKTLMHLADAAEVRVNQQNAARTKLESQIEDLPSRPTFLTNSGERLPFSFVTDEVVQATCQCLLAQASDAENEGKSQAMTEKMILEEFGRCLLQIIHTANGTKE